MKMCWNGCRRFRKSRIAVPVIEAVVNTGLPGQGNLLILGVDMTGDRGLRQYDLENGDEAMIDDPLVFLAQPDSLIVTDAFAKENNLGIGGKVPHEHHGRPKQFTVRGIMKSSGLAARSAGISPSWISTRRKKYSDAAAGSIASISRWTKEHAWKT